MFIPQLNPQVWLLCAGRLLSQIGSGFTLFYAPIFFVNEVGLSATLVGIGLGSASVSGVFGRFFAGYLADSKGRKFTLLLSAAISAIADIFLALTFNFTTLVLGNLLMGLGIGLYWPAAEAALADLTTFDQRNEAFALARLADNLGLGIGVIFGGALIAFEGNYRILFIIDGLSFVLFFALIYLTITESHQFHQHQTTPIQAWKIALSDRRLMIFVLVNILFTTYLAQIQTTLPLYLKNFVSTGGFSPSIISALFTWHIVLAALLQLPVARFLNRFNRIHALMFSLLFWGLGFLLVWVTGVVATFPLFLAIFALAIFSLAMISYTPSASAFVADLSPPSLRGVYLSINSQCWAIGYFIGPTLGGWILDQSLIIIHSFWLIAAATIVFGILLLQKLDDIINNYIN